MNPLPDDKLDLAILLFKSMSQPDVSNGQLSGLIGQGVAFEDFKSRLEEKDLWITGDASMRKVECHLPSEFFLSLDRMLDNAANRISPLPRFYLADSDCLYDGGETGMPKIVQNYMSATRLYALLEKASDHQGGVGSDKTLVFLNKEKIEITADYRADDLRDLVGLAAFKDEFIDSDIHQESKKTIVKTTLCELFNGKGKVPFSELLIRFDDFLEKVRASYQLYVAEFSFQKVKEEVEREKLEAFLKLNKVFSDIQNQLLVVPIALLLAGGQMEDKKEWTGKNILIWIGILIFAIFMDLLIKNQRNTLDAVKQEIDQQKRQLEKKYHSIEERFSKIYADVDNRYLHQKRLLAIVDGMVAISCAITSFMIVRLSVDLPSFSKMVTIVSAALHSLKACFLV